MSLDASVQTDKSDSTANFSREILNAALSLLVVLLVSWSLWYYFDLSLDAVKSLFIVATGGVIGTIFGFLGDETRQKIRGGIKSLFLSKICTRLLAASVCLLVAVSLLLTRVEVTWKSGKPTIVNNGKAIDLDEGDRSINFWGLPFHSNKLFIGDRSIEYTTLPIMPKKIELSEGDVFSGEAEYINISDLLRLSFFQYVENRFLSDAKVAFASDRAKKYIALDQIHNMLEMCFVKDDISQSGNFLFDKFKASYPSSSWIGLLEACLMYGKKDYASAIRALETPSRTVSAHTRVTYEFFDGVNKLRSAIKVSKPGASLNPDLIRPAILHFQNAESILNEEQKSYFRDVALPSTQILQGIAYVYSKDLPAAAGKFETASSSSYPGLKARALNGLGFINLIQGDVSKGKEYFSQSLDVDNSFPYAKTNLAYCYMAEGRYEQAQKEFSEIIKDETIRRESMRDVILARVGLAHVLAAHKTDDEAVREYSEVMKSINMFDHSSIESHPVRLVYIYKSLADKLYGDNRYYGLEVFSLAMYSLAYKKIVEIEKIQPSADIVRIKRQVIDAAIDVKRSLQSTWFVFKAPKGFFAPVYEMSQEIDNLQRRQVDRNP